MKFRTYLYLVLMILPSVVFSQKANDDIINGNKHYNKGKFGEAEVSYRKALAKDSLSFNANYNLGDALYKQNKYDEALKQYQKAMPYVKNNVKKASADLHNIGNSLLQQKKYDESIKAYKMALKMNPKDNDTRYNLAYAQAMLKKNQNDKNNKNNKGGDKNQNQDQKQNKNQDQNKKDNDQNKNQDNKNQDKQDKDQQQKQQQNQSQQPQMSKENAQQLLDALQQDEKDTKDKADRLRRKAVRKSEKNW